MVFLDLMEKHSFVVNRRGRESKYSKLSITPIRKETHNIDSDSIDLVQFVGK